MTRTRSAVTVLALFATAIVSWSLTFVDLSGAVLSFADWAERAQRVPTPVLATPNRATVTNGGGPVVRERWVATIADERPITGGPITGIAELDGSVFYGTFDGGAWRASEWSPPERLAVDDRVNAMAVDHHRLWFATNGGAFVVDEDGTKKVADGTFTGVAAWHKRVYLVSPRGLSTVTDTGLVTRGPSQGMRADQPATLAACGTRLCIGALDGLWLFDGKTFEHRTRVGGDLPAEWVTAVAAGDDGQVWAGTFDGGLGLLGAHARRYAPSDELPDGRVQNHALVVVDGVAYAGTAKGLLRIDGERVSLVDGLDGGVTAIAPARGGGLWLGSEDSIRHITLERSGGGPLAHHGEES